jgi:hypothetical protein
MLKLLNGHLVIAKTSPVFILDQVQLEGKTPVSFDQFTQAYSLFF